MAKEELKLTKPKIIISEDAGVNARKRITKLDRQIQKNPEAFITAIGIIGKIATGQTVEFSNHDDNVTYMKHNEANLISLHLGERDDREIEFDSETETSIDNDPDHQELLNNSKSQKPVRYSTGVMKSENRPSLGAEPARDLVRLSRLGHFIGRVAAFQDQQQQLTPGTDVDRQAADTNSPSTDLAGA